MPAKQGSSRARGATSSANAAPKAAPAEVPDELDITTLRAEVLAAIPSEIWEEAVEGFGDPDLANA